MKSKSMAALWDVCLPFLYGDDYVQGLSDFLKVHKVKRILDCSCGTGFPSLELASNGFDVVFSDGSRHMLAKAKNNAAKKGIKVSFAHLKWRELSKTFGEEFDCVLCRGNSLVYVDSWGKNKLHSANARKELKVALKNFYAVLKPGGLCYIDVPSRKEFAQSNSVVCERFGKKNVNGGVYSVVWLMKHDRKKKIRTWLPQLLEWSNGSVVKRTSFDVKSYLLEHSELIQLLHRTGFSRVEKYVPISGEHTYDVFIAHKPAH